MLSVPDTDRLLIGALGIVSGFGSILEELLKSNAKDSSAVLGGGWFFARLRLVIGTWGSNLTERCTWSGEDSLLPWSLSPEFGMRREEDVSISISEWFPKLEVSGSNNDREPALTFLNRDVPSCPKVGSSRIRGVD